MARQDRDSFGQIELRNVHGVGRTFQQARQKVLEAEKNNPDSKAGAVYYSYLDEATVEKLGMKPVTPWLNRIRAVQNKIALQQLIPVAARDGIRGVLAGLSGRMIRIPKPISSICFKAEPDCRIAICIC